MKSVMRRKSQISPYYMEPEKESEKDYLEVVIKYIEYYHKRARVCKYQYYTLGIIKLMALAALPVIQAVDELSGIPGLAVGTSGVCLFIEAILEFLRTKEKWILYRSTNNSLMSEQRQYMTSTGKYYNSTDKFQQFVGNVEGMISDEARKWSLAVKDKEENTCKKNNQ